MDNIKTLQTIFIYGLFGLLFFLLMAMLQPFFTVILWAALLYVLFKPLHGKIFKKMDKTKRFFELKRNLLAAAFSVGIFLLIIGPLVGIGFMLVQQLLSFLTGIENFLLENPDFFNSSEIGIFINGLIEDFSFINLNEINLKAEILNFVQNYSSGIFSMGKSILSGTGAFILSLLFTIFALYFCFLDGPYLASLIGKIIPIDPDYMKTLGTKFSEITRNLFSGYILVALYQGLAAFIIMSIFKVQGALLFSVVLMIASFIPLLGAAIVWVPIGIVLCLTKSVFIGILFLILCGFCVSFLDNFLRPLFLKDRINVHPLVIFFSILGGLQVFGMNGLLLGPMIVILFFTVLDMLVSTTIKKEKSLESLSDGE
ncbi:MAG: AI-2E family transporter [Candidatus Treponema excrementipullorum]|uniref:AI-2E family transporter n=1 Tax=Candidatus Treponema excrementipullorum TaxID=2838768 RepID=A0A9E2L1P7_9SPIR|nr:AI-2E family transporter [Candidatus Treponema excrementipullorum]